MSAGPLPKSGAVTAVALIINTANQPEYLSRVLRAVTEQTSLPEEVLLADDGSGEETRKIFAEWQQRSSNIESRHVWQKNEGFRRARILNKTIAEARSEYIVFLDGDTLPHPEFIADHRRLARKGAFIQGHRALVRERASAWFGTNSVSRDRRRALLSGQFQGLKQAFRWPFPLVRARTDLRGIRGCNLAIWRADLVRANGYNEAFVGWGREDSELAVRLMNAGLRRLDVRGWAVCWHLWHPPADRAGLPANDELLAQAQRAGATRCEHGLAQHASES